MRMRVLLAMAVLAATTLAGCAGDEPVPEPVLDLNSFVDVAGLNASHPDYGLLTNAALVEAPAPGVLFEDIDGVRVWYKPVYEGLFDGFTTIDPVKQVSDVPGAGGIAIFGSLAFAGARSGEGPMAIVDISIPTEAKVIGTAPAPVRDADTILYPDGRLVVISTAGARDIFATDVTEPSNATLLSTLETPRNNHNIAVVPGTWIVYNTGSGPAIDIVSYEDPENPQVIGEFENGDHCHDISFSIDHSAGRYWAICAGYGQTEIWDISNATAPEMLMQVDYPSMEKGLPIVGGMMDDVLPADPAKAAGNACYGATGQGQCNAVSGAFPLSFSHLAIVNHDATVLIMGDETGGGAQNGCDFYYEGPDGQTYSGPIGNLWFYDISDPTDPDLRGHVSPSFTDADDGTGSCTAHFGKVLGETDYLVISYYTAGALLVDFADLDNPKIVHTWDEGGDIWDVQFHQGYLYTGDITRGMDVLKLN